MFFCLISCRREDPTSWDVHVLVPIAYGTLSLDDLVPPSDSILIADADGLLHYVLSDTINGLELDSLVQIPDTVIRQSFTPPFAGGPFTLPPGTQVWNSVENLSFAVSTAQIKEIIASGGTLNYSVQSQVDGELDVSYDLPGVTLNGQPFLIEIQTQPGSVNSPYESSGEVDLTGYEIDLTGEDGTDSNTLSGNLVVDVSSSADESAQVFGSDSLILLLTFQNADVEYARGFFGQQTVDLGETIDLELNNSIAGNPVFLEAMDLDVELINYVGVDVSMNLTELTASRNDQSSVSLNHSLIGATQNITRATEIDGEIFPNAYTYEFDEENSNLTEWVGLIPEELAVAGEIEINPLGDISGGNDFIFTDQSIELIYNLDVPLCVGVDNVLFVDTLEVDSIPDLPNGSGVVWLYLENSFPMGGTISLKREGEESLFLAQDEVLVAGFYQPNFNVSPALSSIQLTLSEEDVIALQDGEKLVLEVLFSTSEGETVKLSGNERIDVKLVLDASIEVEVE
ncbi:MAG: hypothetical protein HRT74_06900 [Flavobacteriales bacterium]|nr:hypothetical protein [Flavobacteriales bacterium]